MTTNKQPIEKVIASHQTAVLEVHSIWHTLQGEGPFAGCPAVFVRLAGCNLQCPWCDTDYTSERTPLSPEFLVERVQFCMEPATQLIVITGGEPFRQPLLRHLDALLSAFPKHQIQIESNGTLYQTLPRNARLSVVCSPKSSRPIPDELLLYITAFKYVVEWGKTGVDGLPTSVLGNDKRVTRPPAHWDPSKIYVQPLDSADPELNAEHAKEAARSCLHHGYRLCLQMHKLVGLD